MNNGNLYQKIFRVAYDIYERSGHVEGRDLDNWLEAEKIVRTLRELAGDGSKKVISINIPVARGGEEGEFGKWMIRFFERYPL